MAKIRRNGLCPCGSGSKPKRCCYGNNEPAEVHCLPAEFCKEVAPDLVDVGNVTLRSLFDELPYLLGIDTTLQLRLGILTPAKDSAIRAIQHDGAAVPVEVFDKVVAEVDSPGRRIELARAVLSLRHDGRIPSDLAATAILELDLKESTFFLCSVVESLAVLAGDRSTPAGLLVATR